jgi:hypothetical protein
MLLCIDASDGGNASGSGLLYVVFVVMMTGATSQTLSIDTEGFVRSAQKKGFVGTCYNDGEIVVPQTFNCTFNEAVTM